MSAQNPGVRILIVDDEPDTARTLSDLLCRLGFASQAVTNANLAVEAVRSFKPHLMLLDLAMPGQSGFQVLKQIREDSAISKVVVAVVSGFCDDENRQAAFAAGADHVLPKPLDLPKLAELATVAAERARSAS